MIDYSVLPGSIATPELDLAVSEGFYYTVTAGKDETPIYQDLNQRLTQLETSTDLHEDELKAIEQASADLIINVEAKEEVRLRIDWLKRLYDVKGSLPSVSTSTEAKRIRTMLNPVQTCPLKSELLKALDRLADSIPAEPEFASLSANERVMEFAIEHAVDDFINLGKAGREHIVKKVLRKFGEDVSVASIQKAVSALEDQVARLAEIEDAKTLQKQLETLPLPSYAGLSTERKQMVVEQLIQSRQWKGLASLSRLIHQLDAKLSAAEEQDELEIMKDYPAAVLDVKHLDSNKIRLNSLW
ncbi:hypothetical protein SporoP37_12155 [Sporosarcina sp. P37]|uniref:hypothetical protein n=1 Tax=unclassified Sporosarcina TaxID=2647733 RepID=UPI000A17CBE4|nr:MULTISPECIES: hypothetical protein [unclassified Sporosarcina]ARK25335.1 hypothetical protein SporoP37_12155 [Sporosarcina sp. P37]PID16274.1 hypothetical protein CSV62_15730 [Sporosarcina sp. P35]